MHRRIAMLFVIAALAAFPAKAGGARWAPIPASAWAIKAGDPLAPRGAVVLTDQLRATDRELLWWYRVRIVTEEGRAAAEFGTLSGSTVEMEGRTIYPDGTSIAFNSEKDLKTSQFSVGTASGKSRRLVAPGVTGDCIVEYFSRKLVNWHDVHRVIWHPQGAWPVLTSTYEIDEHFPATWQLLPGNRAPEAGRKDGFKTFTWTQLPALEQGPFILNSAVDQPRFFITSNDFFFTGDFPDADAYWQKLVGKGYRERYESIKKGWSYSAFLKEVGADLPKTPQAAARMVLDRVRARIRNVVRLSWEDTQAVPKASLPEPARIDSLALSDTIKAKATDDFGMIYLVYQLLQDLGVKPRLAYVADRDQHLFRWSLLTTRQFDSVLMGVDEPGQPTLWLDPARPLAPAGFVHPDFQGVSALVIDSANFTGQREVMKIQPAGMNLRTYTYQVRLEDEAESFSVEAAFAGGPAYGARNRFLAMEPAERTRTLREEYQARLPEWTLKEAQVEALLEPDRPLLERIQGSRERDPGRTRTLHPFPGLVAPVDLPSAWPATRRAALVLPFAQNHSARSVIRLPRGARIRPQAGMDLSNRFGRVQWSLREEASAQGPEALVELVIELRNPAAGADGYPALRTFLGWVEEALRRQVLIEQGA